MTSASVTVDLSTNSSPERLLSLLLRWRLRSHRRPHPGQGRRCAAGLARLLQPHDGRGDAEDQWLLDEESGAVPRAALGGDGARAVLLLHVNLSCCSLRRVPSALLGAEYPSLHVLDLSVNHLESLQVSGGPGVAWAPAWPNLSKIDVTDNQLRELPAAIRRLRRLEVLRVGNNSLKALDPGLAQLTELRWVEPSGPKGRSRFFGQRAVQMRCMLS